MMKQLQRPYSLCLYDGLGCENDAIRAHSVQNAGTLESLCKDGHVVMPQLVLTRHEPPRFEFQLVGRNNATTFTGLCADHDADLFRPLDTNGIDLGSDEHLFLLSYRAVLKEAHTTRKSAIDTQLTYQRGIEEGLHPKDVPCAPGEQAMEQMISAWLIELCRARYEHASINCTHKDIKHRVIELDAPPCLAVNSMFSTEVISEETGQPKFCHTECFSARGMHGCRFSYYASERNCAIQAFDHIFNATGHYQNYLISKLILKKCENFVLAPDLFKNFGSKQVELVTNYFERNICGQVYDNDAPEIYLFEPVA